MKKDDGVLPGLPCNHPCDKHCWELEKNSKSRPATWRSKLVKGFEEMNEDPEVATAKSAGGEGEVLEVEGSTTNLIITS